MSTLLQISDPHLLSDPEGKLAGVPTWRSLRSVLQRARDEVADPARLVLSGDLSHECTVAGYELLKDLLGDWAGRSLPIPGNHDDRRPMRTVFAQVPGEADEDAWFREELGNWQLIGLDSQVPGEDYGELSDATLDRLAAWLLEDPMRPTLVFLHHPPLAVNCAWIDKIGLRNPGPFETLLRRGPGVCGVFCGHVHQVFEGRFAGIPCYSAPSASFQFAPKSKTLRFDTSPPGFRVIELGEARFRTRVVRLDKSVFTPRQPNDVW